MKSISDILRYSKKIELSNTTNFLVDVREKLNDLTQVVNMIENNKRQAVPEINGRVLHRPVPGKSRRFRP